MHSPRRVVCNSKVCVDYKDLVNEVFESLESGLREESGRGTLKPDEVQVRFIFFVLHVLL